MSRELFNPAGKRFYLTDSERKKFLAAADDEDRLVRSFCYVLAHTEGKTRNGILCSAPG